MVVGGGAMRLVFYPLQLDLLNVLEVQFVEVLLVGQVQIVGKRGA